MNSPEVREPTEKVGLIVLTSTPDGVRERTRVESALWAKVIKDAGIQPE